MLEPYLPERVAIGTGVEPVKQRSHLLIEPRRRGCFVMDVLAVGAGDHLARPAPSSRQAPTRIFRIPLRPAGNSEASEEKSLSTVSGCSKWLLACEHHFDDRLDVWVRRLERADVHAEAAREWRTAPALGSGARPR